MGPCLLAIGSRHVFEVAQPRFWVPWLDQSTFDAVIKGNGCLLPSCNDYDWLGSGIYFWEHNCERAWQWARELVQRRGYGEPAVIGAVIDLGYCLNLTDSHYIGLLKKEYLIMKSEFESLGAEMPSNKGKTEDKLLRRLDCAVIEHLHARMAEDSDVTEDLAPFDSARGLFAEGKEIYPGAGFKEKTHVQICVRNPNCIKGYFDPRTADPAWRIP